MSETMILCINARYGSIIEAVCRNGLGQIKLWSELVSFGLQPSDAPCMKKLRRIALHGFDSGYAISTGHRCKLE